MTRSETPIKPAPAGGHGPQASRAPVAPPWLAAVAGGLVFVAGAIYVLAVNRWHLTAPVVLLLLSWAAMVTLGLHLIRMATSVVADDDRGVRVTGSREDLEREKRKLVKAIKEVEFDRETGKMSDNDATGLIAAYRVRAIAVLKDLDALDTGGAETARAKVEADLRARLALDDKVASATRSAQAKASKAKARPSVAVPAAASEAPADEPRDGGGA